MPFLGVYPTFFGSLESCVPLTLCPNFPGAGLPYLAGVLVEGCGVPMDGLAPSCVLRTGDSGRGSDGLDFLN